MSVSCEVCVSTSATLLRAIYYNKIIGLLKYKGCEGYEDFFFFFFWLLERNLPYFTSCKIDNSRSQSQWKTKEIAEIYQSDLFRQLSKCVLFTLYSGHTLLIFHIIISLFVSCSVKEAGKDYLWGCRLQNKTRNLPVFRWAQQFGWVFQTW